MLLEHLDSQTSHQDPNRFFLRTIQDTTPRHRHSPFKPGHPSRTPISSNPTTLSSSLNDLAIIIRPLPLRQSINLRLQFGFLLHVALAREFQLGYFVGEGGSLDGLAGLMLHVSVGNT